MKEIDVNLESKKYPVFITNNFDSINLYLDEHKINEKILIVTDQKIDELYSKEFLSRLKNKNPIVFKMKEGEHSKNLETISSIYDTCFHNNFTRSSAIIALGGGVIGDTAGFAASTYMRGIKFIQVPTTIIADVDSSIGGKVGVNFQGIKNLIGAFYHPEFIYINTSVLRTLEKRQVVSGIAEVIKYAILFDSTFFNYLEENSTGLLNLESDRLKYVIKKCINMKLKAIQNDIHDRNERQILNFGHTLGHVIESISSHGVYHGEAIALGMMYECILSNISNILSESEMMNIFRLLGKFGLIFNFSFGTTSEIFKIMRHDKKAEGGNNRFIFPNSIGNCTIVQGLKEDKLVKGLQMLKNYIYQYSNNHII